MNPLQKNSKTILFLLALTAIILLFLYYKNFVSNSNNKADTIPTTKVKGINKQETDPFPLLNK